MRALADGDWRGALGGDSGWTVGGALALAGTIGIVAALAGPLLAVLVVGALVGAYALVAAPGLVFAAYLLIPFYKGALQPYLPVDLTILLGALNAVQVVPVVLSRRERDVSGRGIALWVAFASLVVAGIVWAPDQALALSAAIKFVVLVSVPLILGALRVAADPRYVRQVIWSFLAIGILAVVIGVLNLSSVDRLVVLGMNTIQVAVAAMLVPLVTVAFVLADGPGLVRTASVLLVPVAFVVAIASGSRGPILTLLVMGIGAGMISLARRRTINRRVVLAVAAIVGGSAAALVLGAAFLPALSTARFGLLVDFLQGVLGGNPLVAGGDTSSETRLRLFGAAISIFNDHPLIGAGTAGFASLSGSYAGTYFADLYPHNAILQIAAEYGVVGLTVFGALALTAFRRRLPAASGAAGLQVVFTYLLFNAMLSGDILEDRMTLGLLVLLLVVDRARPADDGEDPEPVPTIGRRIGPADPSGLAGDSAVLDRGAGAPIDASDAIVDTA